MPGDSPHQELRRALHEVADLIADYVGGVADRPVLPDVEPGAVRAALPTSPPERPEAIDAVLADNRRLI
jgi:aromatic-L-amino-acid decarboxylase